MNEITFRKRCYLVHYDKLLKPFKKRWMCMEWKRCPRCNSNRVGMRYNSTGCFGIIMMIVLATVIMQMFNVYIINLSILSIVPMIAIVVFFFKFRKKQTTHLYCKDCELMFKT